MCGINSAQAGGPRRKALCASYGAGKKENFCLTRSKPKILLYGLPALPTESGLGVEKHFHNSCLGRKAK